MRIPVDNNIPVGTASPTVASPATRSAETPLPPAPADGLQLSKSADTLSRIAKNDAASRSQRVSQLAAAGRSGSYKVDAAAVSRAIVDHAIAEGRGSDDEA